MLMTIETINAVIPLWHSQMVWAKELIKRSFRLNSADQILSGEFRGTRIVPGTTWFIRTHGIGVDIYKTPDVGGIDFDFDKLDPDPWRMRIFIVRQVNDGNLHYDVYRDLIDDEDRMEKAVNAALTVRFP
jgi:hypothetical protein